MSARSCSTKAPLVDKKSQASPAATEASRLIPASDPHWLSSVLGTALRCDPQPSASASFRSDHGCSSPLCGGAISGLPRTRASRMASEAQKGVLAGRARSSATMLLRAGVCCALLLLLLWLLFRRRPRPALPSFAIALADPRLGLDRDAELSGPRRPLRHDPFYGFPGDVRCSTTISSCTVKTIG